MNTNNREHVYLIVGRKIIGFAKSNVMQMRVPSVFWLIDRGRMGNVLAGRCVLSATQFEVTTGLGCPHMFWAACVLHRSVLKVNGSFLKTAKTITLIVLVKDRCNYGYWRCCCFSKRHAPTCASAMAQPNRCFAPQAQYFD